MNTLFLLGALHLHPSQPNTTTHQHQGAPTCAYCLRPRAGIRMHRRTFGRRCAAVYLCREQEGVDSQGESGWFTEANKFWRDKRQQISLLSKFRSDSQHSFHFLLSPLRTPLIPLLPRLDTNGKRSEGHGNACLLWDAELVLCKREENRIVC